VGAMGTLNLVPSALEAAYGSRAPTGVMVFVRLRPLHSPHAGMGAMKGMPEMHDMH